MAVLIAMRQLVVVDRVADCAIQPVAELGRPGSMTRSQWAPLLVVACPTTGRTVCAPVIGAQAGIVLPFGAGTPGVARTPGA